MVGLGMLCWHSASTHTNWLPDFAHTHCVLLKMFAFEGYVTSVRPLDRSKNTPRSCSAQRRRQR